ncbi:hypothetical protein HOY82DRAFT_616204 [Tuber indicum]|nr:hypothetical protein HOY82DRAFT_616204 [Tuber indicum]
MDESPPPLTHVAIDPSTRTTSPEGQSQREEHGPPRQHIGVSQLDTEGKPFRYLDFAEGGTNAALNKLGQFLQLGRLVVGGVDPESWNYISVEPRSIFRLEHVAPAQILHEPEQEEGEDEEKIEGEDEETMVGVSRSGKGTQGGRPDNPEWKPSISDYSENPAYRQRHDGFNALCMNNQGLGLRFSGNTNISELEHYYRNDRWPEVRYTVEGKVKVVLQHYIQHGEIIQEMCLTSESTEETELSLEFEFTTGIRITPWDVFRPKSGQEDATRHFLETVPEGETPRSHWTFWRDSYYETAS